VRDTVLARKPVRKLPLGTLRGRQKNNIMTGNPIYAQYPLDKGSMGLRASLDEMTKAEISGVTGNGNPVPGQ
jgi:hypothetical protein